MMTTFSRRASHVDAQWNDVIVLLESSMRGEHVLCQLGLYTGGCEDLTFDLLDEPVGDHVHRPRDEYVRIGRQLSAQIGELEAELLPVRTGSLIRVVLHAPNTVLHCDSVVPDQHVIGFAPVERVTGAMSLPEAPVVRDSDRLVADLANKLRERMSLHSQNPGGWLTERPVNDDSPDDVPVADSSRIRAEGATSGPQADLCRKAVDPRDLHYVAWCRDGEPLCVFDCFDDRHMSRHFNRMISPADRRDFYAAFCAKLPERVGQLGRTANRALGGRLQRIVFDVEQGAIYYYRLGARQYLVGVTLKQAEVANTDRRLARLAAELHTR